MSTAPARLSGALAAASIGHPVPVAAVFGAGAASVLIITYLIVMALGLPYWVLGGAAALLAIGLVVMLLTGYAVRREASSGVIGWLNWRRALTGGALAFAGLGAATLGYMTMRTLGIGPVGTLMAAGVIGEREPLILADFENRTADSTLGPSVTELFRVGLAQSPVINVLGPSRVGNVLARMQRDPGTSIDRSLAMEIAEREGYKAVLVGEVASVGTGYAITARLLSAGGDVLTAHQESAADASGIIAAVGRLSDEFRERVGESLRSIRRSEPLERVTTGSLEALRLYSQALRARNAGESSRAVALLGEAVMIDTTFAMAYRALSIELSNNLEQLARATDAATKAYQYRDRLTDRERYHAIATYHMDVTGSIEEGANAYRTLLDTYPDDWVALNNLGVLYSRLGDRARAEELYRRAVALDSSSSTALSNVADTQLEQGKFAEAARTIEVFAARFPGHPFLHDLRFNLAYNQREYAAAEKEMQELRQTQRGNLALRAYADSHLAWVAATRGRLAEAERHWNSYLATMEQRGLPAEYVEGIAQLALVDILVRGAPAAGVDRVEAALARHPLDSMAPGDRPYSQLAWAFALGGRPARARNLLAEQESAVDTRVRPDMNRSMTQGAHGLVAMAEGRFEDAVREIQGAVPVGCSVCGVGWLARAYDLAGEPDSAVAVYERYVNVHSTVRPFFDFTELANALQRLGELYESRGDREMAVEYYNRLVELWEDADAELQPVVSDVRERIARLVGEGSG